MNKSKRKVNKKLPRKLLFVPSSDKQFTEKWSYPKDRDPLDIPKSYRMCVIGKPSCGKSLFLKNVLMRTQQSKKPFERVIVMHQDRYAKEYDDVDAEIITELPDNDFWMGYDDNEENEKEKEKKRPASLLIIDDICFAELPKSQTLILDRLVSFISSHCNVSIIVANQDAFAINPIIRKTASI